jgi:hypothetical protein
LSVEAISWSLAQNAPSPTAKFVLVLLANLADDDGMCWPGIDYIASKSQHGRRTIVRAISDLERAGLVSKQVRPGRGGGRMSNVYRLAMCQNGTKGGQSANLSGQSANLSGQSATVTPYTKDNTKEGIKSNRSSGDDPERKPRSHGFETWWTNYRRKVGKAKCLRFWKSHNLADQADELLGALLKQNETYYRHQDIKFVPHPHTYLNQGRWQDELDPPKNDTDEFFRKAYEKLEKERCQA